MSGATRRFSWTNSRISSITTESKSISHNFPRSPRLTTKSRIRSPKRFHNRRWQVHLHRRGDIRDQQQQEWETQDRILRIPIKIYSINSINRKACYSSEASMCSWNSGSSSESSISTITWLWTCRKSLGLFDSRRAFMLL